jgi:hypothetical protein
VAYSSLHRVTMQDSSLLSFGHSNCSSAKKSVTSPVWCSRLTSLAPGPGRCASRPAAGREAGGQVDQQGVLPQGQADGEGERQTELVSIVPTHYVIYIFISEHTIVVHVVYKKCSSS